MDVSRDNFEDFKLIKDKIIKTDQIIGLYAELKKDNSVLKKNLQRLLKKYKQLDIENQQNKFKNDITLSLEKTRRDYEKLQDENETWKATSNKYYVQLQEALTELQKLQETEKKKSKEVGEKKTKSYENLQVEVAFNGNSEKGTACSILKAENEKRTKLNKEFERRKKLWLRIEEKLKRDIEILNEKLEKYTCKKFKTQNTQTAFNQILETENKLPSLEDEIEPKTFKTQETQTDPQQIELPNLSLEGDEFELETFNSEIEQNIKSGQEMYIKEQTKYLSDESSDDDNSKLNRILNEMRTTILISPIPTEDSDADISNEKTSDLVSPVPTGDDQNNKFEYFPKYREKKKKKLKTLLTIKKTKNVYWLKKSKAILKPRNKKNVTRRDEIVTILNEFLKQTQSKMFGETSNILEFNKIFREEVHGNEGKNIEQTEIADSCYESLISYPSSVSSVEPHIETKSNLINITTDEIKSTLDNLEKDTTNIFTFELRSGDELKLSEANHENVNCPEKMEHEIFPQEKVITELFKDSNEKHDNLFGKGQHEHSEDESENVALSELRQSLRNENKCKLSETSRIKGSKYSETKKHRPIIQDKLLTEEIQKFDSLFGENLEDSSEMKLEKVVASELRRSPRFVSKRKYTEDVKKPENENLFGEIDDLSSDDEKLEIKPRTNKSKQLKTGTLFKKSLKCFKEKSNVMTEPKTKIISNILLKTSHISTILNEKSTNNLLSDVQSENNSNQAVNRRFSRKKSIEAATFEIPENVLLKSISAPQLEDSTNQNSTYQISKKIKITRKPPVRTGGFKRPNRSQIVQSCPASPPPETEENPSEPVLIPLEKPPPMKPKEASELIRELLTFPTEDKVLEKVAKMFSAQEVNHIATLILSSILSDKEKAKLDENKPNIPLMTDIQRILYGLMLKLESTHELSNLIETYLDLAELRLFRTKNLREIENLARLHVAICKSRHEVHRMRKVCCDSFFFMEDFAIPFLFTVLVSWIEILPKHEDAEKFPLAKVMVQLVQLKTCNLPGYNLIPLRNLLHKYYEYPSERWDSEAFFIKLFNDYLKNPVRPADYPILLYCKNGESKWVCDKLINLIGPVVDQVKNENFKATLIILMSNILSQHQKLENEHVEPVREWFKTKSKSDDFPEVVLKSIQLGIKKMPNPRLKRGKKKKTRTVI